jgi:predicted nucleotidyltransferase
MSTLPTPIQSAILKLEAGLRDLYGDRFRGLLLYGSYARGDARGDSDVDLLLLLQGPVDPGREILATGELVSELSLASESLLALIPADFDSYDRGEGIFFKTIRKDALPVAA